MNRRTVLAIAAALLGIVASASVAWLASQVAAQRIGLSSEPPSVAAGLVPRSTPDTARPTVRRRRPTVRSHTRATASRQAPVAPAPSAGSPTPPAPSQPAPSQPAPSPAATPTAAPRAPSKSHEDLSSGGSSSQRDD